MTEPLSASEIRKNIRESLRQLMDLQEQGRIVMTRDRFNTDWPDSATATTEAIAGLEHAMDAMYWMETLPPSENPPLQAAPHEDSPND